MLAPPQFDRHLNRKPGSWRCPAGNTSAAKTVGEGAHELRLDFGPGYRVYLGLDGDTLVILLGGSTKKRQDAAIAEAKAYWKQYRARKRRGE